MIDAVVIGGGLAGAAVATRLAGAGREVVVLEQQPGPHAKVCGEFLSHEATAYLGSLGVDLGALGAVPITALRLAQHGKPISVSLPFPALSLSRYLLDEALLVRAAAAGATVQRGARVVALTRTQAGHQAQLADGRVVVAQAAFLATGKHDLRGWKRPVGLHNDLLAFKLPFRLIPEQTSALKGHVELALFSGGYAGLSLVEDGLAHLCLLVRRRHFATLGHSWDHLLAAIRAESPHVDARLSGAEACLPRPLALSGIPYGFICRRAGGIFRLGDQAAVIPSFAGDGMSIALHSAERAAQAYLAGCKTERFQRRIARDVTAQVLLATGLSHGLVWRPTQTLLAGLARLAPRFVQTIASRTRIAHRALARTQMKRG